MAEHVPPMPNSIRCMLQASLLCLLVPPPPGSTAETLQNYLKLLAEVVKRTTSLAEGLQEIAGSALNVMELAETAFQDALAGHLPLELQWLELLFAARPQTVRAWGVSSVLHDEGMCGVCKGIEPAETGSPQQRLGLLVAAQSQTVRGQGGACYAACQGLVQHRRRHHAGRDRVPYWTAVAAAPGSCTIADGQVVGRCLLSHDLCMGCQDGTPRGACSCTAADGEPSAGLRAWNETVLRPPGACLHRCRTLRALEHRLVSSVGCTSCALLRQWLAVHA